MRTVHTFEKQRERERERERAMFCFNNRYLNMMVWWNVKVKIEADTNNQALIFGILLL